MSIEWELKNKLIKIIEYAYKDSEDPKKERYTWFRLKIETKDMKTKNGQYNTDTHVIQIFNTIGTDEGSNIKTLLHEVSHHIDWVIHGKTGHQKEFYEVYAKLLYSALDLGYVSMKDFKDMDYRSRDYNKVQKILDEYNPHPVENTEDEKTFQIKVSNAYEQKEQLKKRKYFWNKLSKTWDKDGLDEEGVNTEKGALEELGFEDEDIKVVDSNKLNFSSYENKKNSDKSAYEAFKKGEVYIDIDSLFKDK